MCMCNCRADFTARTGAERLATGIDCGGGRVGGPTSGAAGQMDGKSSPWPTPFPLEFALAIWNISLGALENGILWNSKKP